MPQTMPISITELSLDLENYRTVKQEDETHAVQAMIAVSPDRFWALMESLLEEDGYLPTENILVLDRGEELPRHIVKEGNRRIAALKLIYGILKQTDFNIPDEIQRRINCLSEAWKEKNQVVPCAVYSMAEAAIVDRIVTLAHGKGEKAGRDQWNAVARARHNRNARNASEPELDLLEKYLKDGKNLTNYQAEAWAGDYPLTVLEEALKRIATRFGMSNSPELVRAYPSINCREALDAIMYDIGIQTIRFDTIRKKGQDFAAKYGVPAVPPADQEAAGEKTGRAETKGEKAGQTGADSGTGGAANEADTGGTNSNGAAGSGTTGRTGKKPTAAAYDNPVAVMRRLKAFKPAGNGREKLVALQNEMKHLNLETTPLAFCFLLRSMFEISAKAYCTDHAASGGPSATKADGSDRRLIDVLRDIVQHLTKNNSNKEKVKLLHGAMVELGKPEGILSVSSMNQLVHNPQFYIRAPEISTMFGNIFPLLEEMNR